MVSVHCKECRFDKTIIETMRSVDGLDTIYYCDPEGILKHARSPRTKKRNCWSPSIRTETHDVNTINPSGMSGLPALSENSIDQISHRPTQTFKDVY